MNRLRLDGFIPDPLKPNRDSTVSNRRLPLAEPFDCDVKTATTIVVKKAPCPRISAESRSTHWRCAPGRGATGAETKSGNETW